MKIFIATGEVSGDIQGALLARSLYEASKDVKIAGFGGKAMQTAGVDILDDMSTMSTMGVLEGANLVFAFKKLGAFATLKKYLSENHIDLMVLVDNQGVNLILAKYCNKHKIKYVYYFPPHVGVWGAWNARRLLSCHLVITPFMFDYDVYKKYGCNVIYSGHPFADLDYSPPQIPPEISDKTYTVGVLFGSRYQEIEALAPIFIRSMRMLHDMLSGNIRFIIPIAYDEYKEPIQKIINKHKDIIETVAYTFLEGDNRELVYQYSDALILSSGTASLLAACYGKPVVICYKISVVTYFIAKLFYKVKYIGMPNILLNEGVAPELLQSECNANAIASKMMNYLCDKTLYKATSEKLLLVRKALGDAGVTDRIAKEILQI